MGCVRAFYPWIDDKGGGKIPTENVAEKSLSFESRSFLHGRVKPGEMMIQVAFSTRIFLQPALHSSSILPLLLFSIFFSFHNKHPLPSSLPFIRLVFSCKNVSDKTFSLLQCRNFLCVPCQPSGTLWILFRKKKRWKINCIKQMRMHNLGGFSLPLKGNFANLAAALICTAVSISCVASSGCSNTDMQLEEMGVRTAQEISAESWSTCSLLCSSSNAPKGGKLRPKSRQLSRVSALEGFGWRFSVWTRYYVFVSFVREGVGDYGLDLNIEFGRRILITEEGEWLLNSVLQCNAGLDSKLKLRVYFLMMRMDFNVLIWVL